MSAELVAVGLAPVELPCIEVIRGRDEDIARARAACEEADLIVLASSRSLDALWPDGSFPPVGAAVIGPATATSVAERGGTVCAIGNGSLLDLVRSLDVEDARVAIPHAPSTDPRALAELADRCCDLVSVPVYSTAPIGPPGVHVDGVVFVSSSAVHGWALTRSFEGRPRQRCNFTVEILTSPTADGRTVSWRSALPNWSVPEGLGASVGRLTRTSG